MKVIKPSVKRISLSSNIEQIGYAAAICYNSNKQGTKEWIEQLWQNGHRSPFRHAANYYIFPSFLFGDELKHSFKYSPYVGYYKDYVNQKIFVSFNEQYLREHSYLNVLNSYKVNELNFLAEAEKCHCYFNVSQLVYLTYEIVTQVSTSRELNRMSPNSICEQSTRFCNFTKEKYENHIKFCEPHWADFTTYYEDNKETESNERIFFKDNGKLMAQVGSANLEVNALYPLATKGIPLPDNASLLYSNIIATNWIKCCLDAEERYFENIKYGMKAEDARGLLPLDLATKVIYTYRLEEWMHFLNLRLYGKTGKPHSNAKIVAKMIEDDIHKLFPGSIDPF